MVKCEKCGFDAPISEWKMVENSGVTKIPEKTIKEYEQFVDAKDDVPTHMKWFAKIIFRAMGQSGVMPYHSTEFVCPKCNSPCV